MGRGSSLVVRLLVPTLLHARIRVLLAEMRKVLEHSQNADTK